jgi:hypothetical protein
MKLRVWQRMATNGGLYERLAELQPEQDVVGLPTQASFLCMSSLKMLR